MNWSDENIKFVEKAIELNRKGFYIDSTQTVDKYNEILDKHRSYTNCPSCIKQMINELEVAYNRYKQTLQKESEMDILEALELTDEKPKKRKKKQKEET